MTQQTPQVLILDASCCCDTLSYCNFFCIKDSKLTSNVIYIEWFYADAEEWLANLLEKHKAYIKEKQISFNAFEEYSYWLNTNALMPTMTSAPYSQQELKDLQLLYQKQEYKQYFKAMPISTYNEKFIYVSNPYTGFYIEHLGVLACHNLPWNTMLLPKSSNTGTKDNNK